jgi:hypothetical protein
MPTVMKAQTTAAKTDAIWLREERVISTYPFNLPDHSGYAKVIAGDVPVSIK